PGEAQLRNPWHVRALAAACERGGGGISPDGGTISLTRGAAGLAALPATKGPLRARPYCFAGGALAGQSPRELEIATGILPVRGQMVLFRCSQPPIRRIVNEGSRYLVPRDDGHLLTGSTEEEVGFDKSTTQEAIAELTGFARGLVPALNEAQI